MEGKNYWRLRRFSLFYKYYAFVDTEEYLGDQLFIQQKVEVSFGKEFGKKDYCFVENLEIENFRDKIEKIILCKWNRKYPGDFFFTIDVNDGSWKLKGVEEFSGSSHEKITLEVYEHE